jgi:hypothetical protein
MTERELSAVMSKLKGNPFTFCEVEPGRWIGQSAYGTYEAPTKAELVRAITADFPPTEPPCEDCETAGNK